MRVSGKRFKSDKTAVATGSIKLVADIFDKIGDKYGVFHFLYFPT